MKIAAHLPQPLGGIRKHRFGRFEPFAFFQLVSEIKRIDPVDDPYFSESVGFDLRRVTAAVYQIHAYRFPARFRRIAF